jgi:hypothetical protein
MLSALLIRRGSCSCHNACSCVSDTAMLPDIILSVTHKPIVAEMAQSHPMANRAQ